jgi:hypothetical protein
LWGSRYLPIVYYCLAGSQIEGFREALVSCSTQQLSELMMVEKVFQIYILHNFFMPDFLFLFLLLNKTTNTRSFEVYRTNKKEIKKSSMKNL